MPRRDLSRRLARVAQELSALLAAALDDERGAKDGGPPLEQAILAALAKQEPLTGKQLASKTGYVYARYLRATLAGMVKRGVLARDQEGYRRVVTER